MPVMTKIAYTTIIVMLLLTVGSTPAGERVFIHLTDNFKENDGPVCVAFNTAWQAFRQGDEVEIFFDQDAAYGIKQWEPGKTDLGLYPLPDRVKELLADTFDVPVDSLPANYQVYLQFLSEQGVTVTVNDFWNALTQIEQHIKDHSHILSFVEPLTLKEFLAHRAAATQYLRF